MAEKAYKTMKSAGVANLVIGICIIVTGIAAGVVAVINGARLLKGKSDLLF